MNESLNFEHFGIGPGTLPTLAVGGVLYHANPPSKIEVTRIGLENIDIPEIGESAALTPLRHRLGPAPEEPAPPEDLVLPEDPLALFTDIDEEIIIDTIEDQKNRQDAQGALGRHAISPVLDMLGIKRNDGWFDAFALSASELGTNAARHTELGITFIALYRALRHLPNGATAESLVLAIGDNGKNDLQNTRIPIGYAIADEHEKRSLSGRHGRGLRLIEGYFGKRNCGYTYVDEYPEALGQFGMANVEANPATRTIVWAQAPLAEEPYPDLPATATRIKPAQTIATASSLLLAQTARL